MALFKLVWVLIAVPEKNALFESAFAEGNLFAVLQSLVDTLYRSHKGHRGWQKPRCGPWLLQITHLGKGVSPKKTGQEEICLLYCLGNLGKSMRLGDEKRICTHL